MRQLRQWYRAARRWWWVSFRGVDAAEYDYWERVSRRRRS